MPPCHSPRLSRFDPVQRVNPDPRMGIENAKRLVLPLEMLDDPRHHDVLQHIGVISGMKGVAIVHVGCSCQNCGGLAIPGRTVSRYKAPMTATDTTIAATPRPSFAILVAISAIGPLALNLMIPSMPGLQKTFGVPYGTVQLTLTLYLIGMAVCQLVLWARIRPFRAEGPCCWPACRSSSSPACWPPSHQPSKS